MASYLDNNVQERGFGKWKFVIYQPDNLITAIKGWLTVGKDFHSVYAEMSDGSKKCVASFPSQNVAYVIDASYVEQ